MWTALCFVFQFSTIAFLVPASLILMAFFRTNRPFYEKAHRKTFAYFLFDKAAELFSCLAIVAAFYLVAAWMVDGSSDQLTLGYLWELEDQFVYFKNILSNYVILKPWISALLIAGLIVVDLVYSYVVAVDLSAAGQNEKDEKPKSLVSRYLAFHKLSKRAYVVLALLCSFTFFGNAVVGEKIARVQLRIEKIRTGYEEARKDTEAALTTAVQQRLFDKIDDMIGRQTFQNYSSRHYHDIVYTSHRRIEALQESYSKAKSTAYIKLERNLEARVNEVTNKPYPAYSGPQTVPYSDDLPAEATFENGTRPTPEPRPENLKELTLERIEEVNKSLKDTAKLRRSISAIKLADGTEILVQLPKSFTEVGKGVAFHELTARFPFLEPMFEALVSSFDKTVEEQIKTRVGPKLEGLLAKWFPGDVLTQDAFRFEAGEIVNPLKLTLRDAVIKDTKAAAGEFSSLIAESEGLTKELESRMEIARKQSRIEDELLTEPDCVATAQRNYKIRRARAQSMDDILIARRTYEADLERLKERGPG